MSHSIAYNCSRSGIFNPNRTHFLPAGSVALRFCGRLGLRMTQCGIENTCASTRGETTGADWLQGAPGTAYNCALESLTTTRFLPWLFA
jgi:hypothetical protein